MPKRRQVYASTSIYKHRVLCLNAHSVFQSRPNHLYTGKLRDAAARAILVLENGRRLPTERMAWDHAGNEFVVWNVRLCIYIIGYM